LRMNHPQGVFPLCVHLGPVIVVVVLSPLAHPLSTEGEETGVEVARSLAKVARIHRVAQSKDGVA